MFCDIWGYTTLSERESQDVVLTILNELCAIIVRQIQARNGQVLKFLGDGLLVVFPGENPDESCGYAVQATLAAQAEIRHIISNVLNSIYQRHLSVWVFTMGR